MYCISEFVPGFYWLSELQTKINCTSYISIRLCWFKTVEIIQIVFVASPTRRRKMATQYGLLHTTDRKIPLVQCTWLNIKDAERFLGFFSNYGSKRFTHVY